MHPAFILTILLSLFPSLLWAMPGDGKYTDPIAPVILGVTGILFFALIGRFLARKLGQPSVLGELIMGVVVGNIGYQLGFDFVQILREGAAIFDMVELTLAGEPLREAANIAIGQPAASEILNILHDPGGPAMLQVAHTVDVFSRYGVIFLLFLVGLETSIKELGQVGKASSRVAIIGVVMPFMLGFVAARLLMPELSLNVDLFVAATLGATSIGITARVLQDLNRTQTREAQVILGAAIIDDVLGLLMLAIVSGIIVSGGVEFSNIITIILVASMFLVLAFLLGPYFLSFVIKHSWRLDVVEAKMFVAFLFVMVLAWMANLAGLATIIGAFAAGVILQDTYFEHWSKQNEKRYRIKELVMPLEVILVPIFFVLMGIQVKVETFLDPHVIIMATGLTIAAVIGKLVSGLGAGKGVRHLAIGAGMIPRGEVGLIFASIGKSLGVINDALFSAVVLMVIVTTMMTPPLLKYAMTSTKKA